MKTQLTFVSLFFSINCVLSQTFLEYDSLTVSYRDQVEDLFEHVNLTEIDTTNGLLDKYGHTCIRL